MLSGGEFKKLYSNDFVIFEAQSPARYADGHELRKLTRFQYTPAFVFVDANGKKVLETRGFRNEREAKAMHEFVAKRHYLKMELRDFLSTYPD